MIFRVLRSAISHNHGLINKRFAGHSKWSNIRHIKGAKDAQRGDLFTKLGRQMKVAVQEGGSSDPKANLKLEQVIEQAKRMNMPSATIQSILRSSQLDKSQAKAHLVEIKGPGSCIVLCETFTDNLHQMKQQMATILRKHSSKFSDGGGKHLFNQKGLIEVQVSDKVEGILETATEAAIEAGAEDVKLLDDILQFICAPSAFMSVQKNLLAKQYKITSASIDYVPLKVQSISDSELEVCSSLYDKLEAMSQVVKVYDNIA